MKPPKARTRTPVRGTTPNPCCNHDYGFASLRRQGLVDFCKSQPSGGALLLAQLGAHGGRPHWRSYRSIKHFSPACRNTAYHRQFTICNQQAFAKRLGILSSALVILIDELTEKGLVER